LFLNLNSFHIRLCQVDQGENSACVTDRAHGAKCVYYGSKPRERMVHLLRIERVRMASGRFEAGKGRQEGRRIDKDHTIMLEGPIQK